MKRFSFQPAVDSLEGRISLSRVGGLIRADRRALALQDRGGVHLDHRALQLGHRLGLDLSRGAADLARAASLNGFGAHLGR